MVLSFLISVERFVIARCVGARPVSAVVVDRSLCTDMADDDVTREKERNPRLKGGGDRRRYIESREHVTLFISARPPYRS